MIGVSNHLLSIVFRFHYHSQKVISSLGKGNWCWIVVNPIPSYSENRVCCRTSQAKSCQKVQQDLKILLASNCSPLWRDFNIPKSPSLPKHSQLTLQNNKWWLCFFHLPHDWCPMQAYGQPNLSWWDLASWIQYSHLQVIKTYIFWPEARH